MSWETALTARLEGDAGVAALVADRIYWLVAKQGVARPLIVLQTISDPRPMTMKGFIGYRDSMVQIDCYADLLATAQAVREAVIAALADDATVGGVRFGRLRIDDVFQSFEEVEGEKPVRRERIDCVIWHS